MNRRASTLAVVSMTAIAGMALAGCSGGVAAGKEKLELWFWGAPPAQQETMQKVLVDGFNASQDEYELEVNFDNAVDKNVQVALSANRGPDVVYGSGPAFAAAYAAEGKLADMTPYAEKYGWKDRILDSMYESGTYDGKLYSLPNSIEDIGVFYNVSVLKTLGVEVPTTYDEFVDVLDKAEGAGLYPSVTGNQGWKPVNQNYISLFLSQVAGGKAVYDALQGTIPWTDPALVEAVQASSDFYNAGYLGGKDYPNLNFDQSMKLLSEEKSPFFIGPSLAFQFASNYFSDEAGNTEDLGFMAFPTINPELPSPYYTLGTTASLSINEASKNKDGAAMVIDYMMSDDFAKQMNETWPGYWAVPLKDFDLDAADYDGLSAPFVTAMQNTIEGVNAGDYGYFAGTFFPPATAAAFTDIDSVWLGNTTAEQFLQKVQKVFDDEKAKGLVPPLPEPAN
ncbi:carbohydrate ABC transporter substrate-binding protein [Microbacterium esteraromaticum]|uniref:Carbohydrate ABC transporter substrate-binding protein n=1 Tax=Microbacterium esteraromaticum TaxID=57043 RepID=A0A7D7WAI0_9MICO|nr:ABC transporter substrate-binding protein [Microbacterium esteraromaticum]QMU97355.1 carbohydrate ABC transporter substrate-binding protein [Microbacterium esteraromaticum]